MIFPTNYMHLKISTMQRKTSIYAIFLKNQGKLNLISSSLTTDIIK